MFLFKLSQVGVLSLNDMHCIFFAPHIHNTHSNVLAGTASVAVAGIIAAMRITKTRLSDHTYLFQGAGEVTYSTRFLSLVSTMCRA